VLAVQFAVPVDFGVIKAEDTLVFSHLDVEVIWAGKNLVCECSELGLGAHVVDLVDDSADMRVLIS
jgi:hypothetical protein